MSQATISAAQNPTAFPRHLFAVRHLVISNNPNGPREASLPGIAAGISELLGRSDRQTKQLAEVKEALEEIRSEVIYQGVRLDRVENEIRRHDGRLERVERERAVHSASVVAPVQRISQEIAPWSPQGTPLQMGEITQTIIIEAAKKAARDAYDTHELEKDAGDMRALRLEVRRGKWSMFWSAAKYVGVAIAAFIAAAIMSHVHP